MYLPHQLAGMKLGSRLASAPVFHPCATTPSALPDAYARMRTRFVQGHNDICGDCVETAVANALQEFQASKGRWPVISNDYPVGLYETVAGYRAGDSSTDRGTDPLAMLAYWERQPLAGARLLSYRAFDPASVVDRHGAVVGNLGYLLIVNLSSEQQNQRVWEPDGTPGSWGEHCVWVDQYDGPLDFATSWGEETPIDRSYFATPGFALAAFELFLASA